MAATMRGADDLYSLNSGFNVGNEQKIEDDTGPDDYAELQLHVPKDAPVSSLAIVGKPAQFNRKVSRAGNRT